MYKCCHKLRNKTNIHDVIFLAVMVILSVEEKIQQEMHFFFRIWGKLPITVLFPTSYQSLSREFKQK